MPKLFAIIIVLFLLFGFSGADQNTDKEESLQRLKANLEFLASDDLEGRYTASQAEKVAAQFIAAELKKYGVKPYGEKGSYFQDIPLVSKILDAASTLTLCLPGAGKTGKEQLQLGRDFSVWGEMLPGLVDTLKNYEMVFMGYGITAPEYHYDDYAGLDVKGKVVVLLAGEPYSEDPNFFDAQKLTKHANMISKYFLAASKGAAGILAIIAERSMKAVDRLNSRAFNEALCFPDANPVKSEFVLPPVIYLYPHGAAKVFKNEKSDYGELLKNENSKTLIEKFKLDKKIVFNFIRKTTRLTGRNVAGIVAGNDPDQKDELVVLSAHFDHLGVSGGQVFNGADDNGSGVVAVMEIMRSLALEKKNSRSVAAVFYSGEEKGLLGSSYFAGTFAKIKNVVANLNVDMCGRESIDSIFLVGPDLSCGELNEIIGRNNAAAGKFLIDYANSNYEWLNRSDLVPWYSRGVPVADFGDNMEADYHSPGDDADKINFEKVYKTLLLVKAAALEVANLDHRLQFTGDRKFK